MYLSQVCIKRPVFATVISLMMVAVGLLFLTKLQIRAMPDVDHPIITVQADYEGASAEYMERNVTTRIEKVLKTVKKIENITSETSAGTSVITLSFDMSADIEVALNDVRSKISDIQYTLPTDIKPPRVSKEDSDSRPTIWLTIDSSQYDRIELTRIVELHITPILERLASVGQAQVFGAKYSNMVIEPNYVKMFQHKIAPIDIESAVKTQNRNYPAGVIKTQAREYSVNIDLSLNKVVEFQNIILNAENGNILKLGEIAKVDLVTDEDYSILRYNGNRSIAVGVIKQSKANEITLSNDVQKALKSIKEHLPTSVAINTAYDASTPIRASIREVFFTLCEGLLLVILVVYLFLGSFRATLIPAVTIPISLIATFSIMHFFNFSINNFTLLAMVLAVGLVVDDAIVMLENIQRHQKISKNAFEAANHGASEIGFAIIAMTITLTAVFLPIGFLDNFIGKLFTEFAWTLAFCVLFSGLVAITLTPMMASRILTNTHINNSTLTKFSYYFNLLEEKYSYCLTYLLSHKKYVLMAFALSIILTSISFYATDKQLMPNEDYGMLNINFRAQEGYGLLNTEKTAIEVENILKKYREILGFFISIWGDGAYGFVPLQDWGKRILNQDEIRKMLNKEFTHVPGMSVFAINIGHSQGSTGNSVEFNLQSFGEYEELDLISKKFTDAMQATEIFEEVERNFFKNTPTLDIKLNRDKAYLYGANIENIGTTIQYLLAGKNVGDFMVGNNNYNVILRYNPTIRNDLNNLHNILIKTKEAMIPLSVFANIEEKNTVKSYNHYNNARAITITANAKEKIQLQSVVAKINQIANELLSPNISLRFTGDIKQMQDSQLDIIFIFILALIFIYLVLAAQFESFLDPLIILLAVPFSVTGGLLSLYLAGNSINTYSNIGLITLIGLITKNSIMIVEFANQLTTQGHAIKEAIILASKMRLKPILMTSCATILGAIPLVLATGAGAGARNSIGLVVVGGMIIGTFFTSLVIPILYLHFKSLCVKK